MRFYVERHWGENYLSSVEADARIAPRAFNIRVENLWLWSENKVSKNCCLGKGGLAINTPQA